VTTPLGPTPGFSVTKATVSTPTAPGDTLDYVFIVANTGNVTINDVVVTDAKCAAAPVLDSESIAADTVLEHTETQIWSCTSIPVTQAEADAGQVVNDVTVAGTPVAGTLDPVVDDVTTPLPPAPALSVLKSSVSVPTAAGDTIDYTFTVENTGNVSISDVTITDAKCAAPPVLDSETLTADTILEYTETQDGAFEVVKAATTTPGAAGDTINYTFTLVNTGNVSITAVTITDAKCATLPAIDSETLAPDTVLEVGETQLWSCTSIPVTQAEVDAGQVLNDVTVSGTPAGGALASQVDDHVLPITAAPGWELVKATSSTPSVAGDTLDYTFSLVNTGNVSINDVALADAKCASAPALLSETLTANAVLEVGETQIYTCTSIAVTQAEVDAGAVLNDVAAIAAPAGGILDPVVDDHQAPILPAPALAVSKASTTVPTAAGDTIDYEFTVINTGNVSISDVVVTDAKCATPATLSSETLNADTILEYTETQIWSCTSVPVTQAEADAGVVLNDVTVTGTPAGGTLPPAVDSHEVPLTPNPAWGVVKASTSVPTAAGDVLDYTFTVVNTGNVTITAVAVTDAKCAAPATLTSESIAPNVDLASRSRRWRSPQQRCGNRHPGRWRP